MTDQSQAIQEAAEPVEGSEPCAAYVYCTVCAKPKKPIGRSAPLAIAGGLCDDDCKGYRADPAPDCRWPGEAKCGPGCNR